MSQSLTDGIFLSFDEGLREQGAGDMGMSRRMKTLADAFYGRLAAYEDASGEDAMTAALMRNVYRGDGTRASEARILARYVAGAAAALAYCDLALGAVDFGALPQA